MRYPRAVLFDRDGTLCVDVPYNGDPNRVIPVPGASAALTRLRRAGMATAVISNQSGIGRGLLTVGDADAVNARLADMLGPLGPMLICPHLPGEGCSCRKPQPGLVLAAAAALGLAAEECVVIGDIGADMTAARAAGARGILVPTELTRQTEVDAATEVAPDLTSAIALLLAGSAAPAGTASATAAARAAFWSPVWTTTATCCSAGLPYAPWPPAAPTSRCSSVHVDAKQPRCCPGSPRSWCGTAPGSTPNRYLWHRTR
jgi:D-glycero-D-manno-heptose 1,7-bisphosphate phosphatase